MGNVDNDWLILREISTTKTKQSINDSLSGKYLNGNIVNSQINQVYTLYMYLFLHGR